MTRLERGFRLLATVVFLLVSARVTIAQEAAKPADQKLEEPKPPAPIVVTGVFEAVSFDEIILKPDEWSDFTVQRVVDHGKEIQKGDTLVEFETDKYEKAVREAETELQLSGLGLRESELQLEIAKKSSPMKLKAAEDADRIASEELKEWLTSGRNQRVASSERSVKSSRDRLAYEEEELRQLERMYKADDLTEDTEEIILKRTRDSVDGARYGLDLAVDANRRAMEYAIPRAEEDLKSAVQKGAIALTEARETTPRQIQQQDLNLGKQRIAHDEKTKKLERLTQDRKWLKVTAPRSGFAYYGGSKRGKWTDAGSLAASLTPGGSARPKSVLMTIVDSSPLKLRVSVSEESLRHVKIGDKCQIKSVAFPDEPIEGAIESVSSVPISEGTFDAVVSCELGKLQGRVLPGMKGSISINPASP